MKDQIIVKRYAEAFFDFASKSIGEKKVFEEFKNIKGVMRENRGFMKILISPEITLNEKMNFVDRVLNDNFSEEFKQFLKLLVEKERIEKLEAIAEYIRITYSYGEEAEALLKTTYALDLELINKIKNKLEAKFRKKFKLYIDLDGTLLGGIQIIIGNRVIDGSVRRRLDDLREKLESLRLN